MLVAGMPAASWLFHPEPGTGVTKLPGLVTIWLCAAGYFSRKASSAGMPGDVARVGDHLGIARDIGGYLGVGLLDVAEVPQHLHIEIVGCRRRQEVDFRAFDCLRRSGRGRLRHALGCGSGLLRQCGWTECRERECRRYRGGEDRGRCRFHRCLRSGSPRLWD